MPALRHDLVRNALLRALGLGLIVISFFATRHLYRMVHLPPAHQGSPAEMAMAAIAFISASAGAVLSFLGTHIFDQVAISPRWSLRAAQASASRDQ